MKKIVWVVFIAILMGVGNGYAGESLNNPELDRYIKSMKGSHDIGMAAETAEIQKCPSENKAAEHPLDAYLAAMSDPCQIAQPANPMLTWYINAMKDREAIEGSITVLAHGCKPTVASGSMSSIDDYIAAVSDPCNAPGIKTAYVKQL